MKKIPILIISLALLLFLAPLVFADKLTGTLGGNGFVSGITGGVPNDPVANPASGHSASSAFSVALTATDSTTIRYTTNGSDPACPSTGTLYSGAITVSASQTIKAIACYGSTNSAPSNVVSFSYTISSNSGSHSSGGGGGGSVTTYCTAVTYAGWQEACFSGIQYRNILTQTPTGCTLTSAQQLGQQKTCSVIIPTTPTASATAPTVLVVSQPAPTITTGLEQIATEAGIAASGEINTVVKALGKSRNETIEKNSNTKYISSLIKGLSLTKAEIAEINYFIAYGTESTQKLGAGERAGVLSSYREAYGKLPKSETEWSDVIKIALGRWPNERSVKAENQAKLEFQKVYRRNANLTVKNDETAIMLIAYGLRPVIRKTINETAAIKTFRAVYGHQPVNPLAWNIVRAIAYSGAKK